MGEMPSMAPVVEHHLSSSPVPSRADGRVSFGLSVWRSKTKSSGNPFKSVTAERVGRAAAHALAIRHLGLGWMVGQNRRQGSSRGEAQEGIHHFSILTRPLSSVT